MGISLKLKKMAHETPYSAKLSFHKKELLKRKKAIATGGKFSKSRHTPVSVLLIAVFMLIFTIFTINYLYVKKNKNSPLVKKLSIPPRQQKSPAKQAFSVLAEDTGALTKEHEKTTPPLNNYQSALKNKRVGQKSVLKAETLHGVLQISIQVGSFKDSSRANRLLRQLKNKGYRAHLLKAPFRDSGTWFRVNVGPYQNSIEAKRVEEKLKTIEHLPTLITKTVQ